MATEARTVNEYADTSDGLHVSLFASARSKEPTRDVLDPAEMAAWLGKPQRIANPDWRPAWSPALYEPGATRKNRNVIALSAIVLDYDDGTPWDEGLAPWREWLGGAHTSYSNTVAHPRYRVILPLAQLAHPEEWARIWLWAEARSGRAIDKACKDPARIYFVPTVPDTWEAARAYNWDAWIGRGLLDVRTLDLPVLPTRVPKPIPLRCLEDHIGEAYDLAGHARVALERRDPERALRWALDNGGRLAESPAALAVGFACGACGRTDTWLGSESVLAMCRHRSTCDWRGRPWAK